MKSSIYLFIALVLFAVSELYCMEKKAAPVMIAFRQSKGVLDVPGAGHKCIAQRKLARSQSEEALGVHQQNEILEGFNFDIIAAENGETPLQNSKGIRISVSPKGSIIPRPSRLSKELKPGIDFILEETETDDSEGSSSSVVTPEATTAEKT